MKAANVTIKYIKQSANITPCTAQSNCTNIRQQIQGKPTGILHTCDIIRGSSKDFCNQ